MKQLVWDLFEETGDIKYYLLFKNMNEEGNNDDRRSRGNNTK